MRTIKISFLTIMFGILFGCGGPHSVRVQPPTQTVSSVNNKKTPTSAPEGETPQERVVRLRAIQIEQEADLKKAQDELKKAEEELKKKDTPAMKQARVEIKVEQKNKTEREVALAEKTRREKEKKQKDESKRVKEDAELLQKVKVTGCKGATIMPDSILKNGVIVEVPTDPDLVYVSRKASEYSFVPILREPAWELTIENDSRWPIKIETSFKRRGLLVKNLCAHGSITISFTLQWEDHDIRDVPLKVSAELPGGRIATEQRTFQLNRYNYYQPIQTQIWQVHLSPQYDGY